MATTYMTQRDGGYTIVILAIGELHASRCVADVFEGDVLTVSSVDTGAVVRQYPAGEWREATVFGVGDYPLYAHYATTPTRKTVQL